MNKIIEIIVTAKGETNVTTKRFAGTSCRDASRFIEQASGPRSTSPLSSTSRQLSSRRSSSVRSVVGIGQPRSLDPWGSQLLTKTGREMRRVRE
jgi:hypothetical protein